MLWFIYSIRDWYLADQSTSRVDIEATIIVDDNLDCSRRTDNSSHFSNTCYGMIVKKQIPKFGSVNCINVLLCQKYLNIFSDLTLVEEAFIACTYPVMSVTKLKPSGTSSTAFYHWIWGHTIGLLQNPGSLFTILPSSNLTSHDVICIAWASQDSYITSNICFSVSVRTTKVLEILH